VRAPSGTGRTVLLTKPPNVTLSPPRLVYAALSFGDHFLLYSFTPLAASPLLRRSGAEPSFSLPSPPPSSSLPSPTVGSGEEVASLRGCFCHNQVLFPEGTLDRISSWLLSKFSLPPRLCVFFRSAPFSARLIPLHVLNSLLSA